MRLHDWLYECVAEVCYDRDYLYLAYVRHFTALMNQIIDRGRFENRGEYAFAGMKSNLSARLEWQLEHRLSWMGSNQLQLRCTFTNTLTGADSDIRSGRFDFSTGEMLAPQSTPGALQPPCEAL